MNAPTAVPLVVGGTIGSIIPQSIEEVWRLSVMVVEAGIAPQALTGRAPKDNDSDEMWKRWGKKATSAVAIVILSGAELGLPPMVSLRYFTVINGKPALYGDGLIDVARRSRKASFIREGYLKNASDETLLKMGVEPDTIAALKTDDDRELGYCWAKRADTGEEKVEIFTLADAKRAGLYDPNPTVRRKKWNSNEWETKPNESPWFRYLQRMLKWRAAGYCLHGLFAEVLGGVKDEFEAREIADKLIEHDAEERPALPSPPKVPSPPSPPKVGAAEKPEETEVVDPADIVLETGEVTDTALDYGTYFEDLEKALAAAGDEASIEEAWSDADVEATFENDPEGRELADKIKARYADPAPATVRSADLSDLFSRPGAADEGGYLDRR